jgi:predicted transcriptional regulator
LSDDRHQQAFEVYAASGPKRTYRQVADQLGVSERTVRHWAKQEKWRQRLGEREAQAARHMADQVIGLSVAHAARNRKMVELALMKVIKAINSDKVKIQVGDLDRLLRLQAFLDGDGVVPTPETLRERPVKEVFAVFEAWMELLTGEELNMIINWRKETHPPPQPPAPTANTPPTQGEANDQAPSPAR